MAKKQTKQAKQKKYLVVSYDSGSAAWFYDRVLAVDADAAVAFVCEMRPYVEAADAIEVSNLKNVAQRLASRSFAELRQEMAEIKADSKSEESEGYAPTNYFDGKTGKVVETL